MFYTNIKFEFKSIISVYLGSKLRFEALSVEHVYQELNQQTDLLSKEVVTLGEGILIIQDFKREMILPANSVCIF